MAMQGSGKNIADDDMEIVVELGEACDPEGWNDPDKKEAILTTTRLSNESNGIKNGHAMQRGLSSFSLGSNRSGQTASSGGTCAEAEPTSPTLKNSAARLSQLLTNTAAIPKMLAQRSSENERLVFFDDTCEFGVSFPATINERRSGHPNRIRTTKFTKFTWLPKSLAYQFMRVANIYFLFIVVLVLFPWSPKNWKSKVLPFVAVLLWTSLKDLYEDLRRHRDDNAENSQKCRRLRRSGSSGEGFEEVTWAEVLAGDVVFTPEDSAFPADLLLLHAAGNEEAFISTVMLDGETSLKNRSAPSLLRAFARKCMKDAPEEWQEAQTLRTCEGEQVPSAKVDAQHARLVQVLRKQNTEIRIPKPTAVLSDVKGVVQRRASENEVSVCPFDETSFLPRGCVLRNTTWVLGVVLYVGDETKTRLNASGSSMKFSNMQVNLNRCVRGLLGALFLVCIYGTIVASVGEGSIAAEASELAPAARNPVIRFFMFCITFYHVVPMSLYVVYEMLKLAMAFQVNTDKQMYDPERDMMAQARSAEIIEEAGQVNFMFSDKTGTLTANEMVFARCHVGGEDLGEFRRGADGAPGEGMARARDILSKGSKDKDPLFEPALNLFTCLAVCHSVQVTQKGTTNEPSFSGMSPDEVALVQVAHEVGSSFCKRVRKNAGNSEVVLNGPVESERRFTILYELAFSSDRKRMSVVVRHKGSIWCITKGADSVMEPLLSTPFSEACASDLSTFSRQGLRTLIVGMRVVEKAEFEAWNAEYVAARNLIDNTKDEQMALVAAKIETGLKFVGLTAVEDRLQEGVPETIESIKQAGIRLWVLTGDKTETAVDIARSCRLFTSSTVMAYATQADSSKDAEQKMLEAHSLLDGEGDTGLVLDGQTLLHALSSAECRKLIYELGVVSRSCICSRLSPMQKLELVRLVREQNPQAITLAIGDGANDVPMIQGAHLGVAIRGKEGAQAVQASDVAISYFRFLVPLLFCHGRRAYRRIALFLCYYLYKNVSLLMSDLWWMHQDGFRARTAFPEYLSIGFNVLYSAWHVIFVIGFDRDVSDDVANARPELYHVGPRRALFNPRRFTQWMMLGVFQGSIAWCVPYYLLLPDGTVYDKSTPGPFWVSSTAAFTAVNIVVNIRLVLSSPSPFRRTTVWPTVLAFLCYGIGLAVLSYSALGKSLQPCMYQIPSELAKNSQAILAVVVASGVPIAIDVATKILSRAVCPTELELVKRLR